jgi:hypothetical protein
MKSLQKLKSRAPIIIYYIENIYVFFNLFQIYFL